jgi:hypothetical protein
MAVTNQIGPETLQTPVPKSPQLEIVPDRAPIDLNLGYIVGDGEPVEITDQNRILFTPDRKGEKMILACASRQLVLDALENLAEKRDTSERSALPEVAFYSKDGTFYDRATVLEVEGKELAHFEIKEKPDDSDPHHVSVPINRILTPIVPSYDAAKDPDAASIVEAV